jgi:hypothetical protein
VADYWEVDDYGHEYRVCIAHTEQDACFSVADAGTKS